ncbi:MAG: hypothetical protein CMH52_06080 [Myxococcales bacterium]|nr:hypothetical protein [Myxococcales bacterium]
MSNIYRSDLVLNVLVATILTTVMLTSGCGPETPVYTAAPMTAPNTPDMMGIVPPKPIGESDAGFSAGSACNVWANIPSQRLIATLHEELRNAYRPISVEADLGGNLNRYTTARNIMFTEVERYQGVSGGYIVECVYTGHTTPASQTEDPSREEINCEHVMPRARMATEEGNPAVYEHQQSDIHNLMPSTPGSNSTRGSFRFGEVVNERNLDHLPSVLGENRSGDTVWQVRNQRRGDIARIVFYMSVRWGIDIASDEEMILRQWNQIDPPDDREQLRNQRVSQRQGNRNPFIDCPELVDRVSDFIGFQTLDTEGNLPLP